MGFGTVLADLDNDGWLDLATANGHVNDSRPVIPYAMPMQLLRGRPNGRFIDESDRSGPAWALPRVGRGLAAGDLDHDGRVDLVAVDQAGPLVMLQNRSAGVPGATHLLTISRKNDLNRDAVGAVVEVEAGGRRWTLTRMRWQLSVSPRPETPRRPGCRRADRLRGGRWPSERVQSVS
ncbi:MAG: VCBS repeat-containing protein [Isosphaeraceae bacterium]